MFELIDKTSFSKMMNALILTREDCLKFGEIMVTINKDTQTQLIYLLYNEYVSLDSISIDNVSEDVNNIINSYKTTLNTLYGSFRQYFLRDLITTLSFQNYKDENNIIDQMKVVYNSLTDDEKDFLNKNNSINNVVYDETKIDTILTNYVRIKTNDTLMKAGIESSSELKKYADMLNEVGSDGDPTQNATILKSVLEKISLGTIHY